MPAMMCTCVLLPCLLPSFCVLAPDSMLAYCPAGLLVSGLTTLTRAFLPAERCQVLAKKMTVLYKLAREQLSKQHHYDFGLRALKSVLVMAGALKRGAPDMPEALVLMRALRDSNLPKFVYDDVPLFLGLVGDLFPGEPSQANIGAVGADKRGAFHVHAAP